MPEQLALDDLLRGLVDGQAALADRVTELERQPSPVAPVAGTWLPTFFGSTGAGVFTYVAQIAYYIQYPWKVELFGLCGISAIITPPTGNMRISLPFASRATYRGGVFFPSISNFNYAPSALKLGGVVLPSTNYIELRESFDNAGTVQAPAANFTNVNCSLTFVGSYLLP